MDELLDELAILTRARYPILYLVSWEEARIERAHKKLGARLSKQVYFWRSSRGFEGRTDGNDPAAALNHIIRTSERAIFVLYDFHPYLDDPVNVRLLRDAAQALKTSYKTLVLASPVLRIPPELEIGRAHV